jgi:hypothetical protein
LIKDILDKIKSFQVSDTGSFDFGLFLSTRENKSLGYSRIDNSVFSSLSILYILNEFKKYFNSQEKELFVDIEKKIEMALSAFKNKDGLGTYNFWKTKPSQHFPNGWFAHRFSHFKLPDDIDDTALAYLCFPQNHDAVFLKLKLAQHADPIKKMYSTWFGKNMIYEQDICALSNLLLCLARQSDPNDELFVSSLQFIKQAILNSEYLKNTFRYSRHYSNPALIIYHLSRLFSEPGLEDEIIKNKICGDILKIIKNNDFDLTNVLLASSYIRLGGDIKRLNLNEDELITKAVGNSKSYYSFIGALLGPYESILPNFIVASRFSRINWKCEALEWAHILEFISLKAVK